MKFDFYSDPSHGWLKVQRKKLVDLGISEDISSCSYQRGDWVYLEEDLDAHIFVETFIQKTGKTVEIRRHHTDKRSRIRGYNPYLKLPVEVNK